MQKRSRIILYSVIGGLLVLAGLALVADWQGWVPAWCLIPAVISEVLGVWILVETLRRNARFVREGRSERWVVRFGVAFFFILFGVGLPLATFKLIPDIAWPVAVLLISIGATLIYRGIVLPASKKEEKDDESASG